MITFRDLVVSFSIFLLASCATLGQSPSSSEGKPGADEHHPAVSAKLNVLAHRLLDAGLKANAFTGDELKPWHMKMDFQVIEPGVPKPVGGSVEEWYAGPYKWRRVYQGGTPNLNGTEWSLSKFEHYQSKPGETGFSYRALNLRVARPVVDPMYQAANIHPDYDLQVKRVNTAGLALNCVSVPDPKRYAAETNPDWLFATMCFDADVRLRLTVAGDTSVQFDDFMPFQGRTVARDVKVIQKGSLIAAMKVTLLEILETMSPDMVRPPKSAIAQPYVIEPGFPAPEPIYQVAAHIQLPPGGRPYQGVALVPVTIRKDGTVKVRVEEMLWTGQYLNFKDSLVNAVSQWKYKPYLVDGEAVEVGLTIQYPLDGKPFVPEYERAKPAAVHMAANDFSSAYDPRRDPDKDLAMAEASATESHKRILMDVGGDWCVWCRRLDEFFANNADLRSVRDANFVLLKVNMSAQNENYTFLHRFPEIPGYPFLFVLDENGKVVTTENPSDLENGSGYDAGRVKKFLSSWQSKQN